MPRARGWLWLGLAGALLAGPASACMSDQSDKEVAEGKLAIVKARDAAGRIEKPYILTLAKAACLDAGDPAEKVKSTRKIHIFSSEEKVHAQIAAFVGKSVRVRGRPFAAHTAHHHAPIVMDIAEIAGR